MAISQSSHMLPGILREGKPFNMAYTIFDDFAGPEPSATDDLGLWDLVGGSAGVALHAGHGGVCRVTSSGTNQAGLAGNVASIRASSTRRIIAEARFNLTDTSAAGVLQAFFGLVDNTSDTPIGASGSAQDYMGFFFAAQGNDWSAGIAKNKSASSNFGANTAAAAGTDGETDSSISGSAPSDATYQVLRMEVTGLAYVKFFIDGVHKKTLSVLKHPTTGALNNLPDDVDLRPGLFFISSGDYVDIDYILVTADR